MKANVGEDYIRMNKTLCLNSELEQTWIAEPNMHFKAFCRLDRKPLRDINVHTVRVAVSTTALFQKQYGQVGYSLSSLRDFFRYSF